MANSTSPVPQVAEGTGAVAKINTLFDAASQAMIGGRDATTTALLVWGYLGGRISGSDKASGTVTLTASNTNYIVMAKSGLAVTAATTTTNWNDSTNYWRLYSVVAGSSTVTSYNDERFGTAGLFGIGGGGGGGGATNFTDLGDVPSSYSGQGSKVVSVKSDESGLEFVSGSGGATVVAIPIACSDETTALTSGAAKVTFRMPYAVTLTAVRASLTTAQTSGSIFTVDINEAGSTILSTKLTIDNTEKTSTTAATAAVISDSSLADDAEITIDIDQIGDGTAKGLKVYLIGTL